MPYLRYTYILILLMGYIGNAQLFGPQQIITTESDGPWAITAADFDGNNTLDVAVASQFDGTISWYSNDDGEGNFGQQNFISPLSETVFINSADVDGDGDMDVLSTSLDDDLVVWLENMDGEGTFSQGNIISASLQGAYGILGADMDGDGDTDVVAAGFQLGRILWFENQDGDGNFGPPRIIADANNNGKLIFAADIDGDGDMDILATSAGDTILAWFENANGDGTSWNTRIIATANPPSSTTDVFAIDIDGDLDLDVVASSAGNNKVAWYENLDGLGNFGPVQLISNLADVTFAIYAADLDNDGDNDVLSASAVDEIVAWYENLDGLGTFGPQQIISTDVLAVRDVTAADLDNDGDLDVLSASRNDDKIAWYENFTILGVPDTALATVALYPNPAKNTITLGHLPESLVTLTATVLTLDGKTVLRNESLLPNASIDVSALASGVYFLQLEGPKGERTVRKFVKE